MLDLKQLVFALTDTHPSLAKAAAMFQLDVAKGEAGGHGVITEAYIDYNRHDVRVTWELYGALAAEWARYSRSLARHEQGHVDYAVARYPAVVRAIKRASCGTANAAAQAQLTLIRKHDAAYDLATQHGATQGARFP